MVGKFHGFAVISSAVNSDEKLAGQKKIAERLAWRYWDEFRKILQSYSLGRPIFRVSEPILPWPSASQASVLPIFAGRADLTLRAASEKRLDA